MAAAFTDHTGSWGGSNQFRLMPTDPLHEAPATADVTIAAAGTLVSIAYTWSHPQDGDQDGLLVVGADDAGELTALWGDSWHQLPPMTLTGSTDEGRLVVGYEYAGGWHWRIIVDATVPGALGLRMENAPPPSEDPEGTGAYAAMAAAFGRPG